MRSEANIRQYLNRSWLWLRPEGELDLAVADELRSLLENGLNTSGCRELWLDFSRVSFIDSTVLGVLMSRYRDLQPLGGHIMITGCREAVYRLLSASGMQRIITIEPPSRQERKES